MAKKIINEPREITVCDLCGKDVTFTDHTVRDAYYSLNRDGKIRKDTHIDICRHCEEMVTECYACGALIGLDVPDFCQCDCVENALCPYCAKYNVEYHQHLLDLNKTMLRDIGVIM